MEIGHTPTTRKRTQTPSTVCAFLVVALVAATTASVAVPAAHAKAAGSSLQASPSAVAFASLFADSTTAYQKAHGIAARLTDVDCVQASSVDYMCSYAVTSPGRSPSCHLMQARWTPNSASLYTVTLAGRVKKCGTLREALRSLR
jgi:hypothetical protein